MAHTPGNGLAWPLGVAVLRGDGESGVQWLQRPVNDGQRQVTFKTLHF